MAEDSNQNSWLTLGMCVLGVLVVAQFFVVDQRFRRMEKTLTRAGYFLEPKQSSGNITPPVSTTVLPVRPPPRLPEVQKFLKDNKIDDFRWHQVAMMNDRWVGTLKLQKDGSRELDIMSIAYENGMRGLLTPDGYKKFLEFEKTLPGDHVQVHGASGRLFDGVYLE